MSQALLIITILGGIFTALIVLLVKLSKTIGRQKTTYEILQQQKQIQDDQLNILMEHRYDHDTLTQRLRNKTF